MNTCNHYNYVKTKAYVKSSKNVFATIYLRSLQLVWRPGFREIEHVCVSNETREKLSKGQPSLTIMSSHLPAAVAWWLGVAGGRAPPVTNF